MRMPPPKPGTPIRPMPKPKGSIGPKVTPAKPVAPVGGGLKPAQWAATQEKAFLNVMKNGNLTPEQKTQAQADYKAQFGSLPKGMTKGGMVKKGMAKGGMANCGASMKPAQGKGK